VALCDGLQTGGALYEPYPEIQVFAQVAARATRYEGKWHGELAIVGAKHYERFAIESLNAYTHEFLVTGLDDKRVATVRIVGPPAEFEELAKRVDQLFGGERDPP
jgi:hypothetical protein